MSVPDGYMTIEQAAERYKLTRAWWYRQVAEGKVTGYTVPGLRGTLLREAEVEEYMTPTPKPRDDVADDDGSAVG